MAVGGLDIGTSGCKFVAYDLDGHALCVCKRNYHEYGTNGVREIDPEEVWDAVMETLAEVKEKCPERLAGFAVTTLGESVVMMDEEGHTLNRSMVTGDKRGIEESRELAARFGRERLMQVTGTPSSEMYALPKLIWMSRNTEAVKKAKFIFLYEDFIAYRLTGQRAVSYSSASRTMAFDIRKKNWSPMLLETAGIKAGMMSHPIPSGTVIGRLSKAVIELTGFDEDTLLIAGGHDQMCAALGAGVLDGDTCEDGMGTCEVMTAFVKDIKSDRYMIDNELACIPYVIPDTYLTYLVMTNCGVLMNWYRDCFFPKEKLADGLQKEELLRYLDDEAGPNPTGLLVIPNFGSSGNPRVDYSAKGIVWGLTIHTRQHEIFRAFKEGMAYHMKLCMESISKLGARPGIIRAVGGGAQSDVTLQIRADVFGIPVCRMENSESGTLGCAILTGMALSSFTELTEAVSRMVRTAESFQPDWDNYKCYQEQYEKYKKLYWMLCDFK